MKTLEHIKNEYAKSKGYTNWEQLFIIYATNCSINDYFHCLNSHENELLILVQKECLKNAIENAEADMFYSTPIVIGSSITNENNIIK